VEPIVALPASLSPTVVVTPGPVGLVLVGPLVVPWVPPFVAPVVAVSVALPVLVARVLVHATRSDPQSRINGLMLRFIGGVGQRHAERFRRP
jgi:hypothetical protein